MQMGIVELGAEEEVWVTGDVHLRPQDDLLVHFFLRFLAAAGRSADRLVLLGDVFDYWIGLAHGRSCAYRRVIEALEAMASAGFPIHFISGNRDFLGSRGLEEIGIRVHGVAVLLTRGERRLVVTHGDLLVKGDVSHRRYSKVVRSRPFRGVCRIAPVWLLSVGARLLREVSRQRLARVEAHEYPIDLELSQAWLANHDAQELLMGHLHREETHEHNGTVTRMLPGWCGERGPYFVLSSNTDLRFFRRRTSDSAGCDPGLKER